MSGRVKQPMGYWLTGLQRSSEVSNMSIPLMVMHVELRWKFRCPCMNCWRGVHSLIGALFPRVCFEPQSMHMAGDIVCIFLCNFKVECLLPLSLMVVIDLLFVGLVAVGRWGDPERSLTFV